MLRPLLLLPLAPLLLLVPPAALALQPIDDFETGPFSFLAADGPQTHNVVIPAFQSHALTAQRKLELNPQGGIVTAATVPGASSGDTAAQVLVQGSSSCRFWWEWGFPADRPAW